MLRFNDSSLLGAGLRLSCRYQPILRWKICSSLHIGGSGGLGPVLAYAMHLEVPLVRAHNKPVSHLVVCTGTIHFESREPTRKGTKAQGGSVDWEKDR